jgi:hypothetical protein
LSDGFAISVASLDISRSLWTLMNFIADEFGLLPRPNRTKGNFMARPNRGLYLMVGSFSGLFLIGSRDQCHDRRSLIPASPTKPEHIPISIFIRIFGEHLACFTDRR